VNEEAELDVDDMNPEARRVVDLARQARTPGDADKRRVRQAIALGLGAATAGAASSVAASASAVGKGAGILVGLRGIVALVLVASAGAGTAVWVRAHGRGPVASPVISAPVVVAPSIIPLAAAPATAATDPMLAELSLLRQAQQALRDGHAAQALALAQRHETLYPASQMRLEGRALEVFSYCALGRKADARRLATALLAGAPRSPLRNSLEESCAMR